MQFDIYNCYTQITNYTQKEINLLEQWCIKDYDYYGLDFSKRPPRRAKKTAYLSYLEYDKFPSGWAGSFFRRFKDLGIKVISNDLRIKPGKGYRGDYLNQIPPLRDYQQVAHDLALITTRGIIYHATGSGKTLIIAKLLETLKLPSIIMVPTLNLLMQTTEVLKKYIGEKFIGTIGEGLYDPRLFTVATTQSLWSLIKRNDIGFKSVLNNTAVLMVDEGHHINIAGKNKLKNTYFQIALLTDAFYRFGFTATPGSPDSLDREILEAATGGVIHYISTSDLIKRGLLTKPIIDIYEVICPQKFSDWPTGYKANILTNIKRNSIISNLAKQYAAKNQSVLITVNRINDHGVLLNEMIDNSVLMIGSTPTSERKEILKDFSNKKIKILISTVINEGVDIPSMDVIIMAGGGKSSRATIQKIGRALRTSEGKKEARIIDFYDNDQGMLLNHSRARMRVYKSEEAFELKKIVKENINE